MPSSATITAFYTFSPLTTIKSAEVNNNFNSYRGHIIPIDPNTATSAANITYDLGVSDHAWRNVYLTGLHLFAQTAGATPPAGYHNVYVKTADGKAYKKDAAGLESQLGGGALVVSGNPAAANTITSAVGVAFTFSDGERQLKYLIGDTSTGTDITVNPQIAAATATSYNLELYLYGTSDTNTVQFDDGTGLNLPATRILYNRSILALLWNGTTWSELFYKA